jgi:uncharacterized protein
MVSKITGSPLLVRVVPFAIFLGLTFFQDKLGPSSRYWVYLAKTVAGAGMIWVARPFIQEMRWKWSWEAVVVGVGVFAMWVGLDSFYPKLDELMVKFGLGKAKSGVETAALTWNPHLAFGQGTGLAWFFILVRILGSALVVPPLEEVFFRSFLYRYLVNSDFLAVPLGLFHWTPFLLGSLLFGVEHNQWLAGILCGFAFQGLVCLKGRLGDAIAAHAITNLLLGLWVVGRGAWQFW